MSINSPNPEVVEMLSAETISNRKLPLNLNQDHHALFADDLQRTIPQVELLRFRNVRISPEGILFKGVKIFPDSFAFPSHLEEWKLRTVLKFLAKNYVFRRCRRLNIEVLCITDYWSRGYFHWLADALTRLFLVRNLLSDLVLILPSNYEAHDFVTSSLRAFGATNAYFIQQNEAVECRSLLMPSHTAPSGHYNDNLIRGVRGVLLTAYGDSHYQGPGERIYISRKHAGKRRVVNEDEISQVLCKFGFQTVCAEDLTFAHQIETCSRARYIISNHGAGLTNMLFMRSGGRVLELRHQADAVRNWFFNLSSALNLNYFYQTCIPQNLDVDRHIADIVVDPKELEKNIVLLLS